MKPCSPDRAGHGWNITVSKFSRAELHLTKELAGPPLAVGLMRVCPEDSRSLWVQTTQLWCFESAHHKPECSITASPLSLLLVWRMTHCETWSILLQLHHASVSPAEKPKNIPACLVQGVMTSVNMCDTLVGVQGSAVPWVFQGWPPDLLMGRPCPPNHKQCLKPSWAWAEQKGGGTCVQRDGNCKITTLQH